MNFSIDCSCGRTIEVTAAHAGGDVRCACGNVQAVPSLSELRHRAGKSRYSVDIAESIRYMVADGQLPADDKCVSCGIATDNILRFVIECERPRAKSDKYWATVALGLIVPWILLYRLWTVPDRNAEVVGRETLVKVPLRLCPHCAGDATKLNRRDGWVRLLEKVPLYRRLLHKYPYAQIASS